MFPAAAAAMLPVLPQHGRGRRHRSNLLPVTPCSLQAGCSPRALHPSSPLWQVFRDSFSSQPILNKLHSSLLFFQMVRPSF